MTAEVAGKLEERDVLLAHRVDECRWRGAFACQPQNDAPRAAKLALERRHIPRRRAKVLFEEAFQNIHGNWREALRTAYPTILTGTKRAQGEAACLRLRNNAGFA